MDNPPRKQPVYFARTIAGHRHRNVPPTAHSLTCHISRCGRRFKAMHELRLHVRAIHNEEFKCARCGRLLSSEKSLKRHRARKNPCSPIPFR